MPLGEFPSNLWPWKALAARGVRLREVALWEGHQAGEGAWRSAPPASKCDPETRLLEAIGPRTRMLATSWVRFQDGVVINLPKLAAGCADRGVALVVDGIQGAGTLQPALEGVAAFATGGHKGLLAPQGLGLLYTDSGFRQRLMPTGSWLSVAQAVDFSRPSTDHERLWSVDGTRLEQGVPNLIGGAALAASLAIISEAGVEAIEAHVRGLVGHLIARLADASAADGGWRQEAERLSGLHAAGRIGSIAALHHGTRGCEHMEGLLTSAIASEIYPSVREGYLRIAFHGWHTDRDVDRVVDWLTR